MNSSGWNIRSPDNLMKIAWLMWGISRLIGVLGVNGRFPYHDVFASNGDIHLYQSWASHLWNGQVPYRDFGLVYPPGMLPILGLSPWSFSVYQSEFLVLALGVDALILRALFRSGRRSGAWLWVVAAPLLGPIFWSRLDIFVAGLIVAGILAFERGRHARAAGWFTVAALIKLWPLLLVVVLWRAVPPNRRWSYLTTSAGTVAIGIIPFLLLDGGPGLWHVVKVQTGSGVEYESLFAFPLYMVQLAGHNVSIVVSSSVQFGGSADAIVSAVATGFLAAGVCFLLWRAYLTRRPDTDPTRWLLLVVVVLLLTDKVLSAQYLVWTAAAVAMFVDRSSNQRRIFVVTCALLFATQLQFPLGFYQMVLAQPDALPFSAAHACVLVFFAGVALVGIRRADVEQATLHHGDVTGADVLVRRTAGVLR